MYREAPVLKAMATYRRPAWACLRHANRRVRPTFLLALLVFATGFCFAQERYSTTAEYTADDE